MFYGGFSAYGWHEGGYWISPTLSWRPGTCLSTTNRYGENWHGSGVVCENPLHIYRLFEPFTNILARKPWCSSGLGGWLNASSRSFIDSMMDSDYTSSLGVSRQEPHSNIMYICIAIADLSVVQILLMGCSSHIYLSLRSDHGNYLWDKAQEALFYACYRSSFLWYIWNRKHSICDNCRLAGWLPIRFFASATPVRAWWS